MSYEQQQLQLILEGALLAAGEPLTVSRMLTLFEDNELPEKEDITAALEAIAQSCEGRGFGLVEVASGYRFQVREDLATWVNRLWEEKPQKYSRALLETLALIAYRQPITRGDIEEVRGVAVSSHIIKTLVEREWVKVVGHRDVPGRPALYATTRQFLDYFNLKSLDELPTLGELRDIDSLNETLEFESLPPEVQESVMAAAATAADSETAGESAQTETDTSDAAAASVDAEEESEAPPPEDAEMSETTTDSDNVIGSAAADAEGCDIPAGEDDATAEDRESISEASAHPEDSLFSDAASPEPESDKP